MQTHNTGVPLKFPERREVPSPSLFFLHTFIGTVVKDIQCLNCSGSFLFVAEYQINPLVQV